MTETSSTSESNSMPGTTGVVAEGGPEASSDGSQKKGGLSFGVASFFLVAQMAGAGFLALPRAVADAGWLGVVMLTIFCGSVAFSGTRLARSWIILEERWPEYRKAVRQPYMEIAYRSLGKWGRTISLIAVTITLGGGTTVYIILMAQFIHHLLPAYTLSTCALVLIVGAAMAPCTWPGTPKDFWQATVLAVASTVVAVVVIIIQILIDMDQFETPKYDNPTIASFSLGFGAIIFSFSGTSIFPTIQNDMADKSRFWKSVVLAFGVILSLYLPVSIIGYGVIGSEVDSNILLNVETGIAVQVAIGLEIINLIGTYVVSFNPVALAFEEMLNIPNEFGWKRVSLRTGIVVIEVIICLAIPDFSLILNLIGGSATTLCTFVLPPLMYMKLSDMKGDWPTWTVPLWERFYLTEIIIVGIIGGICATISAVAAILANSFDNSCFTNFNPPPPNTDAYMHHPFQT